LNRRRFLKYACASAAVVGASAFGLEYFLTNPTLTSPSSSATAGMHMGPAITNLQWTPTKVVSGKVYDGTVSFDVTAGTSPLVFASLQFDPLYPPQIPPAAISQENDRSYAFALGSGVASSSSSSALTANLSQAISDLVGGKQYRAQVTAKDQYGGQTQANLDIPYIREFENASGKSNYLVGAIYLSWWENPCQPNQFCHWNEVEADFAKGTTPLGTPLLGLYNSADPSVIAKHIDWATGFGIDYFLCEYRGPELTPLRLSWLLAHPMMSQMKFALAYTTVILVPDQDVGKLKFLNLNDPSTYSQLQYDFDYMAAHYFTHPSYLRLNGRPVVLMYETFPIRDVSPLTRLKKHMRDNGQDVYLIGDEISYGDPINVQRLGVFDGISDTNDYIPPSEGPSLSQDEIIAEYTRWQSGAHSAGIELVPFGLPGYDDSHLNDRPKGYGYLPKSTRFFASTMKTATQFADKHRLLGIVTFDDWGENTFIEPSVEDGFKYLQTLRDALAGH